MTYRFELEAIEWGSTSEPVPKTQADRTANATTLVSISFLLLLRSSGHELIGRTCTFNHKSC